MLIGTTPDVQIIYTVVGSVLSVLAGGAWALGDLAAAALKGEKVSDGRH
jgi:hypothetical protein